MSQFHRWSELFIPTLRDAPADAETASHKLLLRSGYVRQWMPGVLSYLFLGHRALSKVTDLVREEMNKIGQEFRLPASDENESCEILTDIARKDLRSYKQLPQVWYQIGARRVAKTRDKSGLLRTRESLIASAFSIDIDFAASDNSYQKHIEAFRRVLERCHLNFKVVAAGGADNDQSEAFIVFTESGDDLIVQCPQCGYASEMETAVSALNPVDDLVAEGDGNPFLVHTPGVKTIDDLARFLNVSPRNNMKTLAYIAEETDSRSLQAQKHAVVAFVRGDHQLNEAKLSRAIGGRRFRPMEADEILQVFGSPAGFLGPIGLNAAHSEAGRIGTGTIVFVDTALQGRHNLIAGANKEDFHLKNITPGKHFQPTAYVDLRTANAGDACSHCGKSLTVDSAIEIATVSKLDDRWAKRSGSRILDKNGKEISPSIGRYAINLERLLIATVEQNHDPDGFWLPPQIAPFEVIVTPISVRDDKAIAVALHIGQLLTNAGWDVLLDDRDERPGVKFKDADLIGIPYRINVGKKVTEGTVEIVNRSTHEIRDASITAIAEYMRQVVQPSR